MDTIGHGIDVVDIERFSRLIDDSENDFVTRCFTSVERADVQNLSDSRQRLAGRFAAKEAVAKALGTGFDGRVAPLEIEIVNQPTGEPLVKLYGETAEVAAGLGVTLWRVSISHSHTIAVASVIALRA